MYSNQRGQYNSTGDIKNKSRHTLKSLVKSRVFTITVAFSLILISIIVWKIQKSNSLMRLRSSTQSAAIGLASDIEIRYRGIHRSLEKLANSSPPNDDSMKEEWYNDASFYIEAFDGISGIGWVNPDLTVETVFSDDPRMSFSGEKLQKLPLEPSYLFIMIPSYTGSRLEGFVLGVLDIPELLSPLLASIAKDFTIKLLQNDEVAYMSSDWMVIKDDFTKMQNVVLDDEAFLDLFVKPTMQTRSKYINEVRRYLIVALLFSLIASIALFFAQKFSALSDMNEYRYREMLESVQIMALIVDPTGKVTFCNDYMLTCTGWSRDEVLDREWNERFAMPDDASSVSPALDAKGEFIAYREYQISTRTGEKRCIQFNNVILRDPKNQIIGTASLGEDITDRLIAQRALLESESSLRESQRAARIGHWSWNSTDNRFFLSDEMKLIFDLEPEDESGILDEKIIEMVHPEDKDIFVANINSLFYNKQVPPYEYRIILANGGERTIWAVPGIMEVDDNGKALRLSGTTQDISHRKKLETKNQQLTEQFYQSQKMESVGRLAGGVAHDFNNMLGVILGHTGMLLEELSPDQPIYADLEEIEKAGNRSADLTRQLLAFARKQTVSPKVLDLNQAVEGMLKMLKRLIGEDIKMIWLPGEGQMTVNIDPSQIDQILANLCVNARDAISDIGKVTIETDSAILDEAYCSTHVDSVPGDFVLLLVSDDGCGMDQRTISNIFEPFYTTKKQGEGTGLGLATIYGIVKQNKGFINVYSEPGLGTTFRIYLPRHADDTIQMKKEGVNKPEICGNETILLVEDEESIMKMTTMMLERLGYKVLAISNPDEAIQLVREYMEPIHLLMTDVIMPEMNGQDLAKGVLAQYPNISLLFMSGYTADVIAHHGVLNRGVNFIQKPFSSNDLGKKVRNALDNNGTPDSVYNPEPAQ